VVSRLLAPAEFGEVQAIISFFLQAGVFLQVLGLVTIGVIKRYEHGPQRAEIIAEIERLALMIGLVMFGLVVVMSRPLQVFLNFSSLVPFLLLALSVLIGIPLAFSNSYLQGHQRFGWLARSNMLAAGSKLVLSVGLLLVGLRAAGAVLGVVLSQVVALGYSLWRARQLGRPALQWRVGRPRVALIRPELRYAGLVLVTSLCVNVLLSVDIIAVKHYFDPAQAGLYAGIATVARIIFFLTGPLSAVLIASVALGQPVQNRQLLLRSAGLTTLLGGGALAVFALAPTLIVRLLIGAKYLTYANLLPPLSLAIFLLSLANLLVYYYVALRRYAVAGIALLSLVGTSVLLGVQHQSLAAVVNSLLEGSFGLLMLVMLLGLWRPAVKGEIQHG
jgi:O-antigen/teichoic acid export membrane protein